MKVYFLRHQAAGILSEFPFASPPTDEQIEAFARILRTRHGEEHPKTREPYWLRVYAAELLEADYMPAKPAPPSLADNLAALDSPQVSGTGHVSDH
jgi:hypothetical protein